MYEDKRSEQCEMYPLNLTDNAFDAAFSLQTSQNHLALIIELG